MYKIIFFSEMTTRGSTKCYDYRAEISNAELWDTIVGDRGRFQNDRIVAQGDRWCMNLFETSPYKIVATSKGKYTLATKNNSRMDESKDIPEPSVLLNTRYGFRVSIIDFCREIKFEDRHHAGNHVNLLWTDPENEAVYRFDPYYFTGYPESVEMQKQLDALFNRPEYVPPNWRYRTIDMAKFPAGPQVIENTATKELCPYEEFCVPWSMLMIKNMLELEGEHLELTPENVYTRMLQNARLPTDGRVKIRKDGEPYESFRPIAERYYRSIRKALKLD